MNIPPHRNLSLANTRQVWQTPDTKELYKQNIANPQTRAQLDQLGWIDREIIYDFNSHGFRSIEFGSVTSAGLALGCSHTEGVGSPLEDVWVSMVSQDIQQPIYNLGVGGASMDTLFRLADYWIPELKPAFVLVACTYSHRIELVNENGEFNTYLPTTKPLPLFYQEWALNTANGQLNFRKNLLAIQYICSQHNIPIVAIPMQGNFTHDRLARDLIHCSRRAHRELADKFIAQLKDLI